MNAKFASLVAAIALVLFGASTATGLFDDTAEQRAAASSVLIEDNTGHGSGVVIGKNLVLTAGHVVDKVEGTLKVTLSSGQTKPAKVLWKASGNGETALLEVATDDTPAAPLSCEKVTQGQKVLTYGNPRFLRNIVTYGRVAGFNTDTEVEEKAKDAVVLDLTILSGNSGGAVWDDRGRVVGLASMIVQSPAGGFMPVSSSSGLSLMVPSTTICRLLGRP